MNLSGFFNSFATDDPEGRRTATALLSTMILVALLSLPVLLIFRLINEFRLYAADIILLILIPLFYSFYHLTRRGKLIIASMLFFIITWAAITVMAFYGLGIRDITVLAYILIIFISVLFTGYRTAIVFTVLTIISVWIMALAEAKNLLVPPYEPPLVYARDFSIVIALLLTGILLYERSFRYSYKRINRELEERRVAEEKLAMNEKFLVSQKEELLSAKLKAEESDKLKTAFLQNISHEIRTPMNGIVGFAELLRDPDLPQGKSEEYIEFMVRCSDQLASVINDLIDISKIEVGAVELNLSVFNPGMLIDDINALFRAKASEKRILFNIKNELPDLSVRSDRGKISRILNNIVSNAVKFTAKGGVSIIISKSGTNLVVSVSDTGIGMSEKDLEHIFDRFRQAEFGLTRNFGGSGLGLSICKGNLELLCGTINVKSEIGKGSLFTVTIPVEFLASAVFESPGPFNLDSRPSLKILIVDDDEISFLYLNHILKNINIELIRAKNGLDALSVFKNNPDLDLVLMDLKLPEMSGFEAARRIREYNKLIPVIAVSAYAFEEDKKRAAEYGINDYVSKPVNRNDLILKIRKLLVR